MTAVTDSDARMSAYLDGDLDPAEREALEAELGSQGLDEVDGLRKMLELVSALPEVDAPPDFYEGVRRKMRRTRFEDGGWLSGLIALPFQVLSIVVILAAAAIFLMSELDREQATLERDPASQSAPDASSESAPADGTRPANPPAVGHEN